ncbi:MAG: trypsin-like peptidase domain-containing protein [Acidobacteria bacterium]|nr:trypsin-like peptidase domain-containing protein [Acidobacteriota bacterium]
MNGADASGEHDVALHDGDVIRIAGACTICFSTVPERGDPPTPLRQILGRSWRASVHLQGGALRRSLFFLRDLCHCAGHDASRRARVAWGATFLAVALAVLLGTLSLLHVRAAERRVGMLSAQVASTRVSDRQFEEQMKSRFEEQTVRVHQLEQEKADAEARLGEVSRNLEAAEQRVTRLERQTSDLLARIDTARRSVAMLVVGYSMYEVASGRPLRFASIDDGVPTRDNTGAYPTSVDGTGPVLTSYALGSGFLISGGRIVTNHHVVEPWLEKEKASTNSGLQPGFEVRQTVLHAYFPDVREPVRLQIAAVSAEADVAVLTGAMPPELSPLTLAPPARRVSVGDQIVVIAYPLGFDTLLARMDQALAGQLVHDAGGDPPVLAAALATRNLISPLATVGHVGDVRGTTITYDAASTYGSSGGPVLNANGEVVALNHAVLEDFTGARFGIPVAAVHRLLQQPRSAARAQVPAGDVENTHADGGRPTGSAAAAARTAKDGPGWSF